MTQEALRMALEALENAEYGDYDKEELNKAIIAIKEALAQTQEPVEPPWWPAVENILNEYGLQAIDFVADFKNGLAQTQEQDGECKYCTDGCPACDARRQSNVLP